MASEVKYKKGGGNSCAGNGCSNNRRKLNEWKQTFCELHKQKHEDCSCMIPYRLHTMPSKESIRLQWFLALTLDGSRTLNSQIASGRCSVLYPEDVETVSPEYISAPLSSCISFRFLLSGSCLISVRRSGVMDEKGVQVMTETGMSAKGSIVTDCDSVIYWDNERGIFYFGWLN
jgi:hypothetical protein